MKCKSTFKISVRIDSLYIWRVESILVCISAKITHQTYIKENPQKIIFIWQHNWMMHSLIVISAVSGTSWWETVNPGQEKWIV